MFKREMLEEDEATETSAEATTEDIAVEPEMAAEEVVVAAVAAAPEVEDRQQRKFSKNKKGGRDNRDRKPRRQVEGKKEYEEKMLEVRRVTRVTTGGRQLSFRATMLIGNKNGKVGLGIAKANDVQSAVAKATHDAYKNIMDVTITADGTIPYPIAKKFKSAQIKLVPAKPGTGLKAGSSVRSVLELAGYTNMLSKIVWTNNILNNALLAIDMVSKFKNFALRFAKKVEAVDAAETTVEE